MFVDFADLKSKISIVQVLDLLEVKLKPSGNQLRGPCPIHAGNNPRGFVVTPEKGVWYCFGDCTRGGDMIELYARVRDVPTNDAAEAIAKHFGLLSTGNPTTHNRATSTSPSPASNTLKPLDYLIADHEALAPLGITPETLKHFGAGYAAKGIMRGRLAIPLHDGKGALRAYVGVAVAEAQVPRLLYPKDFAPESIVFNAHRATAGILYVTRDPLSVLKAHENGVENVAAFLGEICCAVLKRVLDLMEEKRIASIDIF